MKFTFAPEAKPLAGYTIKRAIDRGGFGEVYYGLSDSGKEVALKLLQRNQQVELRGVSQCLNLKHPNLVTIFDIKTDADDDNWVIMEYVSGKSLEQVLDDHPNGLPVEEVEQWLTGMAEGIGFLHDRGIVHRDLKPANVFRENGVVKIGDVGLSKFITPSRRSAQTESVGTVYYMAPEVARGKYGSELDVYSLGIILYEMLTGKVPFDGESTGEILMKHLTEPPDLNRIPPLFRAVVAHALEKDPQKRTPGALELARQFRQALSGKSPSAIPGGVPTGFADLRKNEAHGRNGRADHPTIWLNEPAAQGAGGAAYPALQAGGANKSPASPNTTRSFWESLGIFCREKPWLAALVVLIVTSKLTGFPRVPFTRIGGPAFWELLILGLVAAGAYWGVRRFADFVQTSPGKGAVLPPPVRVSSAAQSVPVMTPPPRVEPVKRPPPPPVRRNPWALSPNTVRFIPLRRRLSDLTGSMTAATFWSIVASVLVAGALSMTDQPRRGDELLGTPATFGLFVLSTILMSWAVLLPARLGEGVGDAGRQRIVYTAVGAAVGACVYQLSQWLYVDLTPNVHTRNVFPGLIHQVGTFPLVNSSHQPTLAAFVVFFATLFTLRRWWWHADSFRAKRFRLGSVALTALVAYLIPAAFPFDQYWAVTLATAASISVQLSSPWVPVDQRLALVEPQAARSAGERTA
jgi:eukaryotic-like serine/threonine-protein kinase